MHLVPNAVFAGRFRLLEPLGRADHGDVWLAHHFRHGIPCVIKLIEPESCHPLEAWARLEAEIETNRLLRSEHIAQIFERGICDGVPYLAMEYLDGQSLRARLERVGRLDPATTCRVIEDVAQALTAIHSQGIIHGDLGPKNLFLVSTHDGDRAKLVDVRADLGRYDWTSDMRRRSGPIDAVQYYASPEQLRGHGDVDHRTDIWSLGLIAFNCLTGTRPFRSRDNDGLITEMAFEPLVSPSCLVPELPRAVDAWWRYAMAPEPNERFQSAKQLAESLRAALAVDSGGVVRAGAVAPVPDVRAAAAQPLPSWDADLEAHLVDESSPPIALDAITPAMDAATPDFRPARVAGALRIAALAGLLVGISGLAAFVRHRLTNGADASAVRSDAAMSARSPTPRAPVPPADDAKRASLAAGETTPTAGSLAPPSRADSAIAAPPLTAPPLVSPPAGIASPPAGIASPPAGIASPPVGIASPPVGTPIGSSPPCATTSPPCASTIVQNVQRRRPAKVSSALSSPGSASGSSNDQVAKPAPGAPVDFGF